MRGNSKDSFRFGRKAHANSGPGFSIRVAGQGIHRVSMTYEDCWHCGHQIEQELWKWGKLKKHCRAYWNAMIVEVTSGKHFGNRRKARRESDILLVGRELLTHFL